MKDEKPWLGMQLGLVVFWLIVPVVGLLGYAVPLLNLLAGIILLAHIIEIPLALHLMSGSGHSRGKVVLNTLVFGFTWWLPASKGLFKPQTDA